MRQTSQSNTTRSPAGERALVDGAPSRASGLSFFQGEAGSLLLMACAVLGCVLVAWGLQRNAKRKLAAQEDALEAPAHANRVAQHNARAGVQSSARTQSELAADFAEIATLRQDLSDVGRRVVGEIDARLATVEAAIERAQAATQRLEHATRAATALQPVQAVSVVEPAPIGPAFTPPPTWTTAPAPRGDVQDIVELAAQGHSALQIAQKLAKPVGQVELILALRGTGRSAATAPPSAPRPMQ